MKYSIIGIVLLVIVLGGIYVYTGGGLMMPTQTSAPIVPQNDNVQYNIKID